MTKEIWINLPVKDLNKSKEFFTKLGYATNDGHDCVRVLVGSKDVAVMLFAESVFAHFAQIKISDPAQGAEVMLSFDAESREEVDEMAKKVTAAGGHLFAPPAEIQGWMYGCAFTDLDGHRWNVLYMDMAKMSTCS